MKGAVISLVGVSRMM